jgi:hypothetical protein
MLQLDLAKTGMCAERRRPRPVIPLPEAAMAVCVFAQIALIGREVAGERRIERLRPLLMIVERLLELGTAARICSLDMLGIAILRPAAGEYDKYIIELSKV